MALDENALISWEKAKTYLGLDDTKQAYMEPLINKVCAEANKTESCQRKNGISKRRGRLNQQS